MISGQLGIGEKFCLKFCAASDSITILINFGGNRSNMSHRFIASYPAAQVMAMNLEKSGFIQTILKAELVSLHMASLDDCATGRSTISSVSVPLKQSTARPSRMHLEHGLFSLHLRLRCLQIWHDDFVLDFMTIFETHWVKIRIATSDCAINFFYLDFFIRGGQRGYLNMM